jgi:signal transduction histidine kinase
VKRFLQRLPVRTKIVTVTMLTALVALLLTGGTLLAYEVRDFRARLEQDLDTLARVTSANSVAAISFDDEAAAQETLRALRVEPQIVAACIYGRQPGPFATFSRDGSRPQFPARPAADGYTRAGNRLFYFGAIVDEREHRRVGTLYFEADLGGLRERLFDYALLLGLVLSVSSLVALGLAAMLQHFISGPIVSLAKATKGVAAARDYSLRARHDSDDEFGQLVASFNEMLAEIESRDVALRVKNTELEAANRELEAFSYSVSHDLRSPLRALDGYSHAIQEEFGAQLPDEGRRYLETIRAETKRMGDLIDDLLEFARLSRQPLHKQTVAVDQLVHTALGELNAQRRDREVEIRFGELPPCEGDAALLKQVWINLLSNALKYTRQREHAVVEVGSTRKGADPVVYFVRDNGTGFDMRYAHKLFGVFQRLHRAEDYEGTGVGLAIVQRVIHRHGGRVWAEAAPDRGATFYFSLGGEPRP